MHIDEQNSHLTFKYKVLLYIAEVLAFSVVWYRYYNLYMFRSHWLRGCGTMILVYMVLYFYFARLYRGWKIATYPIGETIFSHFLAFSFSDLIEYIACSLGARQYVSLIPGLITVLVQLLIAAAMITITKNIYMRKVPPLPTLLVYGGDGVEVLKKKLEFKYMHLFNIEQVLRADAPAETIRKAIGACDTVILYRIDYAMREKLIEDTISLMKRLYVAPVAGDYEFEGFSRRNLIDTPMMKFEYYYDDDIKQFFKRTLDIIFSIFFLVLFSPAFLITMVAIKIEDQGPIFFRQDRVTKDDKVFSILKFRSMRVNADQPGEVNPYRAGGDPRVTRVGNVIRKFRIDELPQFINVLTGDMSIVGPRPERVEHVQKYCEETPEFAYRTRVKAGLTGLAQIYGKYNTSAYDKVLWDIQYIENQSILLDLRIVMLTVKIMFTPESSEGFDENEQEFAAEVESEPEEKRKKS